MNKMIVKLYKLYINVNHFFTYGESRVRIFYYFLSLMSSISILIMFFKLPQSPETLLALSIFISGMLGVIGYLLFRYKAQQIDRMMEMWRNPVHMLSAVALFYGRMELYKKFNLPFPEKLKGWGIESWDDITLIADYMLDLGEDALAQPICRKFFEERKSKK